MKNNTIIVDQFKRHLERLGYSKQTQYTLHKYTEEFLEYLSQHHLPFGETERGFHITSDHITEHYNYLSQRPNKKRPGGLSSSSLTHHIYAIRLFLNYHQQIGSIKENPISGLIFPSPTHQPRTILTRAEITQLYHACEDLRDRAILGLFYGCGLRKSEAEKLDSKDIQYKDRLLYVREGKGKKRRVIPLSEKVRDDLQNYYHQEHPLYIKSNSTNSLPLGKGRGWAFMLNKRGGRMLGERYYARLKELIKLTGNRELINKSIGLHNLRHSIATHLLESGLSVEYVRDFLGHNHLETTQIYTRVSTEATLRNLSSCSSALAQV